MEACVINIGPAQRRLRSRLGLAALAVAVVVGVGSAVLGMSPTLRAVFVLPLLFGGFQGIIQAREKT